MAHDTNLICCKCMKDDSEERLFKCYDKGLSTLKEQCAELDLFDLLQRVNDQWACNQLAIHTSCRAYLNNEIRRVRILIKRKELNNFAHK